MHFLTSIVAKHQKNGGDPLVKKFSEKSLTMLKGGTVWGIFFEKLTMLNETGRGDLLVSPAGIVCHAEKEKPF